MSYRSPIELIEETVINNIESAKEEAIFGAVTNVGVNVDKEELLRALSYDREQYRSGFSDGYEAGYEDGKQDTIKRITELLQEGSVQQKQQPVDKKPPALHGLVRKPTTWG